MAIEWVDHQADAGFLVTGTRVEQVFCEAAVALFSIMFDVNTIKQRVTFHVRVTAVSHDELLVEWLSELLAQKEITRLIFSAFELTITGNREVGFTADGLAVGEPLDRDKHLTKTEVKGISYLGLSVACQNGVWAAQVIVDV